jgi:hypothetical protein
MTPLRLSTEYARMILSERIEGQEPDINIYENSLEFSCEIDLNFDELLNQLSKLKVGFPEHLGVKSKDGPRFDQLAAEIIHAHLPLDSRLVGCREFWIWMSVAVFSDIIQWRHGTSTTNAHSNNYGLGNKIEGFLCRLWYRAELSKTIGNDPYALCRKAVERDFWESGIIRPRYSSCRPLTRAFVRFQYPDDRNGRPLLDPSNENGVRMLYKRIKRMQPTLTFEVLSEEAALSLLANLSHDLKEVTL